MLYQTAPTPSPPHEVICPFRNTKSSCLWNPESWALEYGYSSRNLESYKGLESRIQAPLKKCAIKYLESGIYGVESRIQDCLGFPYINHSANQMSNLQKRGNEIVISEVIFQTE